MSVRTFPLEFSRTEYRARIEALLARMQEREIEALVLFSQESMYYLYGYDQVGYWVYQAVVVPGDGGEPIAICRAADQHLVEASLIGDVRVWLDDRDHDPCKLTVDALTERGLTDRHAAVGLELQTHALQPHYYELLRARLAERATLREASDLVAELRTVKSGAEIDYMRRAGKVLDAGFEAGLSTLARGVREREVHDAIVSAMAAAGGDWPALPPPVAAGERTLSQTHGSATDRAIRPGEPVTIEIGGAFRRYHAVGLRSACVGEPPREVERTYDALRHGLRAGYAALGPGQPVAAVASAVREALEESGTASRPGRHTGYGIGIGYPPTWVDSLRIKETDDHVLQPGMCFYFYAGARVDGHDAWIGVGDPVVVTDEGWELLAHAGGHLPPLQGT